MAVACPTCRVDAFTSWQKTWATALFPLRCSSCGNLAAPSWWSALIGLSLPFLLIFGLWLSLHLRSWWPIVATLLIVIAALFAEGRYVPLGRISTREMWIHRALAALAAAFLVTSAALAALGLR